MRRPPDFRDFTRYPVVAATVVLDIVVSMAFWAGHDMRLLFMSARLRRGEVWRFVTSALPHLGVLHLAFNAYWTWVFGTALEATFGSWKTLSIFVGLAVVSSAAEYAAFEGGVGLSGVGYGLFGLLWVLGRRDLRFAGVVDRQTTALFVAWFFLCIGMTVSKTMAVANVAHGAGAVAGALLGAAIARHAPRRGLAIAGSVLLTAAALVGATVGRRYVNRSATFGADEARLGYEALEAGDDASALGWLEDATAFAPDDARHWHNLGVAYARLGRPRDAAAAFRREEALSPRTAPAGRGAGGTK